MDMKRRKDLHVHVTLMLPMYLNMTRKMLSYKLAAKITSTSNTPDEKTALLCI